MEKSKCWEVVTYLSGMMNLVRFMVRNENQKISTNYYNCEIIMAYLREFKKDIYEKFGKEFGKEYKVEVSSKKHEKTEKKLQIEKNKSHCLIVALTMSWILFSIIYKFM